MTKLTKVAHNVTILTEAKDDAFITTATNTVTDELLDSKRATTEQDALKDHDDMITTYALPLQAHVHAARMEKGQRYTIAFIGDFGFPVAIPFTFDRLTYSPYAQYDDAVTLIFTPAGKRKLCMMHLYNHSFVICDGWRKLEDSIVMNVEKRPDGMVVSTGKYSSFDERYMDDLAAAWSDAKVVYHHDRVYRPDQKQPEPMPDPDPVPTNPCEPIPGITFMRDQEHGPFVDMSTDDFAALYGESDAELTVEDKLIRALRRATVASMAKANTDDGGTCNFDSPVLDYQAAGIARDEAERIIKAAGLSCYDWEKMLVLGIATFGQGNRRTEMAEAFMRSMIESGFPSCMYYQMD